MKNMLMMLMLIPFGLFAQNNSEVKPSGTSLTAEEWIIKIASDSELRSRMINMMIEKTQGNETEMQKLADPMMNNPEMRALIMAANSGKAENRTPLLEPRIMMKDSVKAFKMHNTNSIQKK